MISSSENTTLEFRLDSRREREGVCLLCNMFASCMSLDFEIKSLVLRSRKNLLFGDIGGVISLNRIKTIDQNKLYILVTKSH